MLDSKEKAPELGNGKLTLEQFKEMALEHSQEDFENLTGGIIGGTQDNCHTYCK